MRFIFESRTNKFGYIDYVGCWFLLASEYCRRADASAALVATNSICQGRQLPQLWPLVLRADIEIVFAHHSFKWSNTTVRNAGVTCVIVGIAQKTKQLKKTIYDGFFSRLVTNINAYLIEGADLFVESHPVPKSQCLPSMLTGSVPNDGGHLILELNEVRALKAEFPNSSKFIRPFFGSEDYLHALIRSCLLISNDDFDVAQNIAPIAQRLKNVAALRAKSIKKETREKLANSPHRFQHRGEIPDRHAIIIPAVSSERREWFPAGLVDSGTVISNLAFMIVDAPLWNMALIASRIHLVWIATVCGKLKTDFRYSNTLGWNTFPSYRTKQS